MNTRNAFGYPLVGVADALRDRTVHSLAADLLHYEVLVAAGRDDRRGAAEFLGAAAGASTPAAVTELQSRFRSLMGGAEGLSRIRNRRVADILETFRLELVDRRHHPKGKVLDLGCGHGLVGSGLVRAYPAVSTLDYADVIDYRDASVQDRRFVRLDGAGTLPFRDGEFDSVFIITVLHHSDDPVRLLADAVRVCSGSVYIMESVIGAGPRSARPRPNHGGEAAFFSALQNRFTDLSEEQQMLHATWQDWLYNCLVQGDVSVPMNFGTPADWRRELRALGCDIDLEIELGYDQVTAPEFHILYVARRPRDRNFGEG